MERLRPVHKWLFAAALSALLTLLALTPALNNLARNVDYRVLDLWMLGRGPLSTRELPILLVQVTDASLQPYGFRSPTPRTLLAKVVQALDAKGARCIGLDYVLDRPLTPAQDAALEESLAASTTPVVVVSGALPRFARHVRLGHALVGTDARQRARLLLRESLQAPGLPPLTVALYETCFGHAPPLPADADGLLINYYGPPSHVTDSNPTFPVIAADELASVAPELVRGRVVLVGSGLPDLGDTFFTAYSTSASGFKQAFGVEVHATILAMLIEQRFIGTLGGLPYAALLFAFLVLVSATCLFTASMAKVFPLMGELAAWFGLSAGLFILDARFLHVTLPLIVALTAVSLSELVLHYTEARQARLLRESFGRYVAPALMRAMIERRWEFDPRGESYEVSLFFADLQNFTTFSEERAPGDVVGMVSDYFATLSEVVFAQQGTVKDLLGDGLLAYFGAPLRLPDHAVLACGAALRAQHALDALNERWQQQGLPAFRMRIGLHTGEVVIGSIGSERRREIAVVGDAVNVAARLDNTNKLFGSRIAISEATCRQVQGRFHTRELGRVVLRGRRQYVTVHELLAEADGQLRMPHAADDYGSYEAGLVHLYAGRIREAREAFREQAHRSGDRAAEIMALYCAQLEAQPLPSGWDGALKME